MLPHTRIELMLTGRQSRSIVSTILSELSKRETISVLQYQYKTEALLISNKSLE